jgi:hypothetical protein
MQPIYEHRQFGRVMLLIMIIPIFGFLFTLLLTNQASLMTPLLTLLVILAIPGFLFSSLTVKVDLERVLLFFGPGFPRRSFPLAQISTVRVVRNALWMGLGIHFIRGGMIYNVSGRDGVEITLKNGSLARIGTDEPAALAQAIEQVIVRVENIPSM